MKKFNQPESPNPTPSSIPKPNKKSAPKARVLPNIYRNRIPPYLAVEVAERRLVRRVIPPQPFANANLTFLIFDLFAAPPHKFTIAFWYMAERGKNESDPSSRPWNLEGQRKCWTHSNAAPFSIGSKILRFLARDLGLSLTKVFVSLIIQIYHFSLCYSRTVFFFDFVIFSCLQSP